MSTKRAYLIADCLTDRDHMFDGLAGWGDAVVDECEDLARDMASGKESSYTISMKSIVCRYLSQTRIVYETIPQ